MVNGREDRNKIVLREDRGDVVTPVDDLGATIQVQAHEADAFALEFVGKLVRLRGVRIDREHFLTAELRRRGVAEDVIAQAIADRPAVAGVSHETLDEIARQSIAFETKKSTALAFAAGLPGGFALIRAVPADVAQYYVHAFRVMQKLAYLYGWQSFHMPCSVRTTKVLESSAYLPGQELPEWREQGTSPAQALPRIAARGSPFDQGRSWRPTRMGNDLR